jgi:hypothetical protein
MTSSTQGEATDPRRPARGNADQEAEGTERERYEDEAASGGVERENPEEIQSASEAPPDEVEREKPIYGDVERETSG